MFSNVGTEICNHQRSYWLFLESVKHSIEKRCTFKAIKWNSLEEDPKIVMQKRCNETICIEMGANAELYQDKPGTYYLSTRDNLALTRKKIPSKFIRLKVKSLD